MVASLKQAGLHEVATHWTLKMVPCKFFGISPYELASVESLGRRSVIAAQD